MKVGDIVHASLPYGYFYSESATSPLVLVAGGIGVAPFRGMIHESLYNNPSRAIVLFYSNKREEDIIFKSEFDDLARKFPKTFSVKYYVTQEKTHEPIVFGRISVADIIRESCRLQDREYLLCGSIAFVRDFWRGLQEEGVPEETIYTEAFF
jgi:ferredoxin-NADP reductase